MSHAIAAYPRAYREFSEALAEIELDIASLQRPLKRCDLAECRGTCCHDGVYLSTEESEVIRKLVKTSRRELESLGLDLPEKPVVYGRWRDSASGPKTATRPEPMSESAVDYPSHFPDTNCIFLLPDARCGLQILGEKKELSPWFYKPITCWMHPLSISTRAGKSILTLYSEESDPQRYEDYDGFTCRTHCGRTCEGGEPAYRVLQEELEMLGQLGGRDFISEIVSSL